MRVRHPRPSLWPMLVIGAVLLAIIAAAVALAGLPLLGKPAASATPGPNGGATPASDASAQTQPSGEADTPEPADFLWSSAVWLPPRGGAEQPTGYSLQAGTLADPGPVIDLQVPLVVRNMVEDAGRVSVFSDPVADAVLYIADDGGTSQLRRATLAAPDVEEVMAELDPIVWAMAVERDGNHAYLLLVHREGGGDAGVVRVTLDGSGQTTDILGPADVGGQARMDVVPAAVVGFRAWLMLSPDNQHLLRRVCTDPAVPCALDVVDLASGAVARIGDNDAFGIADGRVFWSRCEQIACTIGMTDVETGEESAIAEFGGIATLAEIDGHPVVAYSSHTPDGRGSVAVVDPETGASRELMRGMGFEMQSSALDQSLKIVTPPGWIVVRTFGAGGAEQQGAIRLADGASTPLPPVPRVMPPMQGQG